MSETVEESQQDRPARGGLLMLAAVALVAVPVLVGFLVMRSGDDASSDAVGTIAETDAAQDVGMGGEMGGEPGDADPVSGDATEGRTSGVVDFEEIQASAITIEPDPGGGGAVLSVGTSIDVACAVTFGPTRELGAIATDTDMAGGGHRDHHPLMRGLEDGVTYFYVVSGVAADGTLYQSQTFQYTHQAGGSTPSVPPPAPNVADLARVVDASSEYSDAYGAGNAIDGDLSTEWSSAGDGDDAYIVLEFGEDMRFEGVGFRTREMSDGTSITTSFTVTVGGRVYGPFEAGPGLSVGVFEAMGQQIRIDVETSTGGNTGAVEIEVYGQTDM
jgi:hypothetical protein